MLMFDLFFDGVFAFHSLMMFLGAFICIGLGLLLSGDFLRWRLRAKRVRGKVVTFQERAGAKRNFYYPVAEYHNDKGQLKTIISGVGSSNLDENQIGKKVSILYFPHKPDDARILGAGWPIFIVGLMLLGGGGLFLYHAARLFEFNWMMLVVAMGGSIVLWRKFEKIKKPLGEFGNLKAFKEKKLSQFRHKNKQSGKNLTRQEVRNIQNNIEAEQAKWSWLVLIIGLGLLGGGYYVGKSVFILETIGQTAAGQVTGLKANSDSDGTTYAPIIRFQTNQGNDITFTSNYSSNPPSYKSGDDVQILYDPDNPSGNVMIDAGWMNWLIPVILSLCGLLFCGIIFPKMRGMTSKAR